MQRCARGELDVCFRLLANPRLAPGRRAAIELLLQTIDELARDCSGGEAEACATLRHRYPDLPPDMIPGRRPGR